MGATGPRAPVQAAPTSDTPITEAATNAELPFKLERDRIEKRVGDFRVPGF